MEKKYRFCKIALIVLLVALLLGSVVLHFVVGQFVDGGIHVLGNFAHVRVKETCYFISQNDRQILGQSALTIGGYLYDEPGQEAGIFDGSMDIEAYPLGTGAFHFMGSIDPDAIWLDNDAAAQFAPQCDTFYRVCILRGEDPVIAVTVVQNGETVAFGICGATEEEALEKLDRYQAFRKNS